MLRLILVAIAVFFPACSANSEFTVTVKGAQVEAIDDLAKTSIGALRVNTPGSNDAILPFILNADVGRIVVPGSGKLFFVRSKPELLTERSGEGCLDVRRNVLSLPELQPNGRVFLHEINLGTSAETLHAIALRDPITWIGYDCTAILVVARSAQNYKLTYAVLTSTKDLETLWSRELDVSFPKEFAGRHLEFYLKRDRVVVAAQSVEGALFAQAISLKDGKRIASPSGVDRIYPKSTLVAGSDHFLIETAGTLFRSSHELKVVSGALQEIGTVKADAVFPPLVRLSGTDKFLAATLTEVDGRPRLALIRADVAGHAERNTGFAERNPLLADVVFNTTVIGAANDQVFVAALGTRLEKAPAGWAMKDGLYVFFVEM